MAYKLSTSEFVKQARKVHGDKYDYSKSVYVNYKTKVCIICPIHGEFYQTPDSHLRGGGCLLCYNERRGRLHASTKEGFIKRAHQIHGDKYNYSLVDYHDAHTKVEIICPIHGSFFQTPNSHLNGRGCRACASEILAIKNRKSTDEFILLAKEVHNDKYDYSKTAYTGNKKLVCIVCPVHGEFWQSPNSHLSGNGCPHCRESKGESRVANILKNMGIKFVRQHKIQDAIFKNKVKRVFVDFYIPTKQIIIEYNGEQHYEDKFFNIFGNPRRTLKEQQERDFLLKEYCDKHGIRLIVIPYWNYHNIEGIIKKEIE